MFKHLQIPFFSAVLLTLLALGGSTGIITPAAALDLKKILESAKPCFRRDYSDQHLAEHPKQVVTVVQLRRLADNLDVTPFQMQLNVWRRANGQRYGAVLFCAFASPDLVACRVEGDGGKLDISIGELDGQAGLKVVTRGVTLEGPDFFSFGAKTDDRVFYLGSYRRNRCQG
jgi:hypothetical protein